MRRLYQVFAHTEQDARDMAERRARDARLRVLYVDEVIDVDKGKTGMRAWVVWLSVADR